MAAHIAQLVILDRIVGNQRCILQNEQRRKSSETTKSESHANDGHNRNPYSLNLLGSHGIDEFAWLRLRFLSHGYTRRSHSVLQQGQEWIWSTLQ